MILFRPVGLEELRLIYDSGLRAFPPRLPEQPIFYPVFTFEYAEQMARDWNTKSGSLAGYVTRFEVDDAYVSRFERHVVGARQHEELWVPSEQLDEFNRHILGRITVLTAYFGPGFRGYIPEHFGMAGCNAVAQFVMLAVSLDYAPSDFDCEVGANNLAVFLHYPFWAQYDFSGEEITIDERDRVRAAIKTHWTDRYPDIPLCGE
jgi:hypothetical protein